MKVGHHDDHILDLCEGLSEGLRLAPASLKSRPFDAPQLVFRPTDAQVDFVHVCHCWLFSLDTSSVTADHATSRCSPVPMSRRVTVPSAISVSPRMAAQRAPGG